MIVVVEGEQSKVHSQYWVCFDTTFLETRNTSFWFCPPGRQETAPKTTKPQHMYLLCFIFSWAEVTLVFWLCLLWKSVYEWKSFGLVLYVCCFICDIQIWLDRGARTVAGLSLWWLITIHLAAAVNIDSSRDFQFEPRDILWNITKCVEVRKEIGRGGEQVGSPGMVDYPPSPPPMRSFLMLIFLFNSKDPPLLSVWSYWVEHELIFSALNYWVLLFIFGLSDPLIPVLIRSLLLSLCLFIAEIHTRGHALGK